MAEDADKAKADAAADNAASAVDGDADADTNTNDADTNMKEIFDGVDDVAADAADAVAADAVDAADDATDRTGVRRLLAIMARLRGPGGCSWDRAQSFATIAPYTIEEAYEVADAIERGDLTALRDELGDLLFQVVFHARMAEEAGAFAFRDVANSISDKMLRRHPHVFAAAAAAAPLAAPLADPSRARAWEDAKAAERAAAAAEDGGRAGTLDGVARSLPALLRAEKLQRRAARVGFDWPDLSPVFDKLFEEIAELRAELSQEAITREAPMSSPYPKPGPKPGPSAGPSPSPGGASGAGTTDSAKAEASADMSADRIADEIGDVLFVVANLARKLRIDPEAALRRTNAKFERRFRYIEQSLEKIGKRPEDSNLAEMDALWDEAKRTKG